MAKQTRLFIRIAEEDKRLIERAAKAKSVSVTDIVVPAAVKDSKRILRHKGG